MSPLEMSIEVSSIRLLNKRCPGFVSMLSNKSSIRSTVHEDKVVFGEGGVLVIGLIFFLQSIGSGITYDFVKAFLSANFGRIMKLYEAIPDCDRPNTKLYLEDSTSKKRMLIDVSADKQITVRLPDRTTITISDDKKS